MKSILYVAATLMIGASIYGFVDYSKTSRHKEFKTMYDEPEVQTPVVPEEKKSSDVTTPETISKKEQAGITTEEQAPQPVKKIKKKRTINYESFSRAPLREKVEVVVIPETKEQKDKEQ
jgi:hypothetical protein